MNFAGTYQKHAVTIWLALALFLPARFDPLLRKLRTMSLISQAFDPQRIAINARRKKLRNNTSP